MGSPTPYPQAPTEPPTIVRAAARRLTGADGATFVLRGGAQCHYADEDATSPLRKGQRREIDLLQARADSTTVAIENVRVYEELEEARLESLQRLALAAEFREDGAHEPAAPV
jgi:hypothetical protein